MGRESRLNPFGRPAADAPAVVRDLAGRALHEGDEVALTTPAVVRAVVQKIRPILDPGAPPGAMEIRLLAIYQYVAPRDRPNLEFVRTRERAELVAAGQLKEVKAGDGEAAGDGSVAGSPTQIRVEEEEGGGR